MTKAHSAASVAAGIGAATVTRLALRLVVIGALVAATWVICSLVAGQASAHAAEQPPARTSLLGPDDPDPDSGTQTPDSGGLLGGVVDRVSNLVRKPVERITEPVRQAAPPIDEGGASSPKVPVVGDLLPQQPGDAGITPAQEPPPQDAKAEPPTDQQAHAGTGEQDRAGTATTDTAKRTVTSNRDEQAQAAQARADAIRAGFVEHLAKQAAALGLGSSLPLPDPDHQPTREPAPASPAPPAPTVKISSPQSGGGSERDLVATLPGNTTTHIAVGNANNDTERAHRGPAAPGLPAITPD